LLFEYSTHDLEKEILKRCVINRNYFSKQEMLNLTHNLLNGMQFIQQNNLFHGDLRVNNIFMSLGNYKVAD
jgi:NIMA (never in mitosis gene a)-related kinase